jgi:hypothetical protein
LLEQLFFGAEVVVDRALADLRALGDVCQGGLGVALGCQRLDRAFDQLRAPGGLDKGRTPLADRSIFCTDVLKLVRPF